MKHLEPPPNLPEESREKWIMAFGNMAKSQKKGQSPANKLTDAIRELVEFKYKAVTARISTMGVWSEKLGKHIHGAATLGVEDVDCVIPYWFNGVLVGLKVAIEIKAGRDQLREKQIKRKGRIEAAGALYIEARSTLQVEHEIDAFLLRITQSQKL